MWHAFWLSCRSWSPKLGIWQVENFERLKYRGFIKHVVEVSASRGLHDASSKILRQFREVFCFVLKKGREVSKRIVIGEYVSL